MSSPFCVFFYILVKFSQVAQIKPFLRIVVFCCLCILHNAKKGRGCYVASVTIECSFEYYIIRFSILYLVAVNTVYGLCALLWLWALYNSKIPHRININITALSISK